MPIARMVYFWTSFWTYTSYLFLVLISIRFRAAFNKKMVLSESVHSLACRWGKGILDITPGWSYEVIGKEFLPTKKEPMVFVANHQSAADICALFTTDTQFRWLSKSEVFRIPLIGHAMSWAGYVPISRGNVKSHRRALEESSNWIRRGISMVYFPEGSRSLDGRLKDFKIGAFRLADQENVPVLPIVLQNTRNMMAKNSLVPNPAHVIVKILPPVRKQDEETIEQFTQRVKEIITENLD